MSDMREFEAKFECEPAALGRLLGLRNLGSFRLAASVSRRHDDVYYDTESFDLLNQSSSLRVRRLGAQLLMTFKGPREQLPGDGNDHLVKRIEDEAVMDPPQAVEWNPGDPLSSGNHPSPLGRARFIVGDKALLPVARIRTSREIRSFQAPDESELELAVDRSSATRLADDRTIEFGEVELEVRSGGDSVLEAAAAALQEHITELRPAGESKLERTLR